jgi:hypothetical protein
LFLFSVEQLNGELDQSKHIDVDLHQRKFKVLTKYRVLVQCLTDHIENVWGTDSLQTSNDFDQTDTDHDSNGQYGHRGGASDVPHGKRQRFALEIRNPFVEATRGEGGGSCYDFDMDSDNEWFDEVDD